MHRRQDLVRRRRRLWTGFSGVVILGVVAAVVVFATVGASPGGDQGTGRHPAGRHRAATRAHRHRARRQPATFLGPDGVEARWVIQENRRPGTTAWKVTGAPANSTIDGFANRSYASDGQTVTLYVSSDAPTFKVEAFRMGYYQGKGGRLVWTSPEEHGRVQPSCPVTPTTNMVACDNWHPSLTVHLTRAFVQGDYLFKLVGSGNQQSYVPLTVWDPTSTAAYVVKNDIFTWQAWNPYGGYDFYQGLGSCAPSYPPCNRARIVSFDRPYAYGEGAGDFLGNEYPLVRFAEQHGLDVTYATDLTLEQHPGYLLHHRVLLSLGHDECWSLPERQAADTAQAHGVNLVFFAASAVLRHVRTQASPLGPGREEVDYRDPAEDPLNGKASPLLVTGNTWSAPPTNWPETGLVGEAYAGYQLPGATPVPFVVYDASAWIFRGTGLHDGSAVPGVVTSDIDTVDPAMPHPSDLQVLGRSPIPVGQTQTDAGVIGANAYSDMTYYTDRASGSGVWDSGTNHWIPSLGIPMVNKITGNLLWLFGQGPAGHRDPSVPNWQQAAS